MVWLIHHTQTSRHPLLPVKLKSLRLNGLREPSWFWYPWRHHDVDTHDAIMILIHMTPSWFWYPWRHHDFDTHDAIMILIPMTPTWFWYPWRHHDFDTHDAIMILTPMTPSWFWHPWRHHDFDTHDHGHVPFVVVIILSYFIHELLLNFEQ